jgi:hypothetical protein
VVPGVGVLILLVIGGVVISVKARAAAPAALFSALAVLFIVSTPVGSGVPGAVATVFSVLDSATSPALNHDTGAGAPAGSPATMVGARR